MKIFLASVIVLTSFAASAQTAGDSAQVAIETLKKKVARLRVEVSLKSDSLNSAIKDLEVAESKQLISKYSGGSSGSFIGAVVRRESKLFKQNDLFSEVIELIKEGEVVRLLDYKVSYWLIAKGNTTGFLDEWSILENDEIKGYKAAIKKSNHDEIVNAELTKITVSRKENDAAEAEGERIWKQAQKEVVDRNKKIIAKYGKSLGQKLVDGYYWIGMSAEMAKVSLGEPEAINKSVGSWGVHEQWVYDGIYLYIEKGKVVSYQNSN
ncbi:hypothetical protein ACWKW6_01000 [Dyadobacter jiangsuensis]